MLGCDEGAVGCWVSARGLPHDNWKDGCRKSQGYSKAVRTRWTGTKKNTFYILVAFFEINFYSALLFMNFRLSSIHYQIPSPSLVITWPFSRYIHIVAMAVSFLLIIINFCMLLQGSLATESAVLKLSGKVFDKPFQGPVSAALRVLTTTYPKCTSRKITITFVSGDRIWQWAECLWCGDVWGGEARPRSRHQIRGT